MASHRELSMTAAGVVGHAAFAAWMQDSLCQTFDTVLHEPLPHVLLAILDPETEGDADAIPGQGGPGCARV